MSSVRDVLIKAASEYEAPLLKVFIQVCVCVCFRLFWFTGMHVGEEFLG